MGRNSRLGHCHPFKNPSNYFATQVWDQPPVYSVRVVVTPWHCPPENFKKLFGFVPHSDPIINHKSILAVDWKPVLKDLSHANTIRSQEEPEYTVMAKRATLSNKCNLLPHPEGRPVAGLVHTVAGEDSHVYIRRPLTYTVQEILEYMFWCYGHPSFMSDQKPFSPVLLSIARPTDQTADTISL